MEKFFADLISSFQTQPISVIPAIALGIALIAAFAAWRSSKAARENLRMAKVDFEEKHDSIRAILVDCVTWNSEESEKIASFACTYTNAANAPNTLIRLELLISAVSLNGQSMTIVLDPVFDKKISHRGFPQLTVPINLSARSTASGWISFHLPKYLLETKRINKYQISALTASDKAITLDTHILLEI